VHSGSYGGRRLPGRLCNPTFGLCLAAALAALVAGCSAASDIAEEVKEGNYLQKPFISTPDWARVRPASTVSLGPEGPVGPEDLVDASGNCAPAAPQVSPQAAAAQAAAQPEPAAAPAAPAKPAVPPAYGSMAGDLASAPMAKGPPPKPMPVAVKQASTAPRGGLGGLQPEGTFGGLGTPPGGAPLGGIALGMSECQAVRRGGQPSSVNIGTGSHGERKVVLTYLGGSWPGIYTFESGRLKVVDAAPVPERPKTKPKRKYKKKRRTPARTARGNDVYVR
jgi:hypothetical protein